MVNSIKDTSALYSPIIKLSNTTAAVPQTREDRRNNQIHWDWFGGIYLVCRN